MSNTPSSPESTGIKIKETLQKHYHVAVLATLAFLAGCRSEGKPTNQDLMDAVIPTAVALVTEVPSDTLLATEIATATPLETLPPTDTPIPPEATRVVGTQVEVGGSTEWAPPTLEQAVIRMGDSTGGEIPESVFYLIDAADKHKGILGYPEARVETYSNNQAGDNWRMVVALRQPNNRYLMAQGSTYPTHLEASGTGYTENIAYYEVEGSETATFDWTGPNDTSPVLTKNLITLPDGTQAYSTYYDPLNREWHLIQGLNPEAYQLNAQTGEITTLNLGEVRVTQSGQSEIWVGDRWILAPDRDYFKSEFIHVTESDQIQYERNGLALALDQDTWRVQTFEEFSDNVLPGTLSSPFMEAGKLGINQEVTPEAYRRFIEAVFGGAVNASWRAAHGFNGEFSVDSLPIINGKRVVPVITPSGEEVWPNFIYSAMGQNIGSMDTFLDEDLKHIIKSQGGINVTGLVVRAIDIQNYTDNTYGIHQQTRELDGPTNSIGTNWNQLKLEIEKKSGQLIITLASPQHVHATHTDYNYIQNMELGDADKPELEPDRVAAYIATLMLAYEKGITSRYWLMYPVDANVTDLGTPIIGVGPAEVHQHLPPNLFHFNN